MADAIGVHDVSSYIRHKGDPDRPNAAPIDGRVAPSVMGELGIDGNANDFNIAFAELFGAVRVSDNLRGTDKGKVQWIEEQHRVFARDFRMKVESIIEGAI